MDSFRYPCLVHVFSLYRYRAWTISSPCFSEYLFFLDATNQLYQQIIFGTLLRYKFSNNLDQLYNLDYVLFYRVLLASAVKWESIVLRRYFSPGNLRDFSLELDLLSKRIDFLRSFDPIRDVSNIEKLVSNYYID